VGVTTVVPLTRLDGGVFAMGDDGPWSYLDDGEQPVRSVQVAPFAMAPHAVSNADFAAFVDETGYVTDADHHGWSFVFAGFLPDDHPPTRAVGAAPWWRQVEGASWRRPFGPDSDLGGRWDHPVVHVSHRDAEAWCSWAGLRLPTEAEWEYAARAGTSSTWPWGEDLVPGGVHHANVFQGEFPVDDTAEDGWAGTCPVDAYTPNAFGMWNMVGNVWEWTAGADDREVFSPDRRVIKGGSYLCHGSYCRRFRPGARSSSTPDSSTGNTGFRAAGDLA
jgi:formylglycine-generating enzyme